MGVQEKGATSRPGRGAGLTQGLGVLVRGGGVLSGGPAPSRAGQALPLPPRVGVRAEHPTPHGAPASPGARPRPTCAPSSSSVCPSSSSSSSATAAVPRGTSGRGGRRRGAGPAAGGAWRRRRGARARVRPGSRAEGEGRRLHAPALRQAPAAAPRSLRQAAAAPHHHGVRGHGAGLRFSRSAEGREARRGEVERGGFPLGARVRACPPWV